MQEVYRTTDPGEIALLKSVFESAGINVFLFDEHTSALGSLAAGYMPCRFMVVEEEYEDACKILEECKLEPSRD